MGLPASRVSWLHSFFIKQETLAQLFSCEFCEISKNTFFTEHQREIASASCRNQSNDMICCVNQYITEKKLYEPR